MRKQEYIEKYGLEKWQDHLRYNKQYRQEHPEYQKQYRQTHKEEKAEYNKRYLQTHKEELLEYRKRYYKQYYQTHREELLEYTKQYYQNQYGRASYLLNSYRRIDKSKGFETNITTDWIVDNIFNSKCYYCEESDWTKLGTDRIDNTKGHTTDNCICACGKCNIERGNRYTVDEFKRYKQIRPKIA